MLHDTELNLHENNLQCIVVETTYRRINNKIIQNSYAHSVPKWSTKITKTLGLEAHLRCFLES